MAKKEHCFFFSGYSAGHCGDARRLSRARDGRPWAMLRQNAPLPARLTVVHHRSARERPGRVFHSYLGLDALSACRERSYSPYDAVIPFKLAARSSSFHTPGFILSSASAASEGRTYSGSGGSIVPRDTWDRAMRARTDARGYHRCSGPSRNRGPRVRLNTSR